MEILTVSILSEPSACKVDDGEKAYHSFKRQPVFHHKALSTSAASFTELNGRPGELTQSGTFVLYDECPRGYLFRCNNYLFFLQLATKVLNMENRGFML